MRVVPLGDRAVLLTELGVEPWRVAHALNEGPPRGLVEAVAAYDAVAIHFDPEAFDPECLGRLRVTAVVSRQRHQVPVCYEMGQDLAEASALLGLSAEELLQIHAQTVYTCAAVGFRPGFAYLGPLPSPIAGLPRMATPRFHVEAGSVGITGSQTGVYPQSGPGGWWIIGRTPMGMVDVETGYYPIEAGDEVEFVPISAAEFERRKGECL